MLVGIGGKKMHEYRWHDAKKDKPESGISMLVCFSGTVGMCSYHYAYSVGCYWAEDDEWELQEFGDVPPEGIRIHGWKDIERFALEG